MDLIGFEGYQILEWVLVVLPLITKHASQMTANCKQKKKKQW